MKNNPTNPKSVFFGTGHIARAVLEELYSAGFLPALVITAPDKPQGRGQRIAPSEVAILAEQLGNRYPAARE